MQNDIFLEKLDFLVSKFSILFSKYFLVLLKVTLSCSNTHNIPFNSHVPKDPENCPLQRFTAIALQQST